jgi:hypothetical protein
MNARTCSGTLNPSPTAVWGSIWPPRARLCALHAFATPFAHHAAPDPLRDKLAHLRFHQISAKITISSCSGTLNRSTTVARGSIWPRRAKCSPLYACVAPFVHQTLPDPLNTKVGTFEISADFGPNNYRRGLQQRARVRIHRGVGKSVPEPQRLKDFGCQSIVIGPRP